MKRLIAFGLGLVLVVSAWAMDPFRQQLNGTQVISCTNSNVATALTTANRTQYVITAPAANTQLMFIEFGTSGAVATTTTSYPILPGTQQTLSVWGPANNPTHIACISASGTQTLYVSAGAGE